jgi:hypothetical protein
MLFHLQYSRFDSWCHQASFRDDDHGIHRPAFYCGEIIPNLGGIKNAM